MRRSFVSLLVAVLVLPTAAVAAALAPGDGTLVVREGSGVIVVEGRGTIFGHFDRGRMTIVDYNVGDAVAPQVNGAEKTLPGPGGGEWSYRGTDVRFRFFGGRYKLRFSGTGIDISAVGRGSVTLTGSGPSMVAPYGDYSVDGGKAVPITLLPVKDEFGVAAKSP